MGAACPVAIDSGLGVFEPAGDGEVRKVDCGVLLAAGGLFTVVILIVG